jgi:hypothetical protein
MNDKKYIKLDEEDFKCLVRGGVLKIGDNIEMILADIGFDQMHYSLNLAEKGIKHYVGHTKDE